MFSPHPFAESLVEWFAAAQREMPWRENQDDAYRILVSEVMLQQTTVAAVRPFFERFITRFPDVQTLANAPESDVLTHWAGLGYYARARNLQKAARAVVEQHDGRFPRDLNAILSLPGVGRYTAGAVASIAFGQRAPIVDANVARVLARVLPVDGDLKKTSNAAQLWDAAQQIVEVESVSPREVNPALMELGALVCTPRNPRCDVCPVAGFCAARAQNRQNELPYIAPKKAPTPLFDVCALARRGDGQNAQILLRQRPDEAGVWWRGMWELPRVTRQEKESSRAALERLGDELGIEWKIGGTFAMLSHGVTRFHIELDCREVEVESVRESPTLRFFSFDEALTMPLPSIMKRLIERARRTNGSQLSLLE